MNILIAPDSFKESLSAKQVGECIKQGFSHIFPHAKYSIVPLADGGEGTVEVLMESLNGERQSSTVLNPLRQNINANWALLDNGQAALIELAAASGLDLISPTLRNPNIATSFGTGQLILQALNLGVKKIFIGLGGSATNDGGAGIFQALGGKLLDNQNNELPQGGLALQNLDKIDCRSLHPRCREVEIILACDVSNPLYGPQGASVIFGKQKGANEEDIKRLDSALKHFADKAQTITQIDYQTAGFGAAGGTALGLSLAFNIQIKSGINMVLDALDIDNLLANTDLVITGEGQMDNQTLQGKVPFGIATRAKQQNIPVLAIVGSLGKDIEKLYTVIDATFDSVRAPQSLELVLQEARENIIRTARNVAMALKLGQQL